MRILLIGPDHPHGSLSPYLHQLAVALRRHGAAVDRLSSPRLPYDAKKHRFWLTSDIVDAAAHLLGQANLTAYDLLSIHFGNLELEQILPVLWADRPHAPAVYHVHTLVPTLLRDHAPADHLHAAVLHAISDVDGLVYFGHYAQKRLHTRHQHLPATVAWWPTTIPIDTPAQTADGLAAALYPPRRAPILSVYGFASPWKNAGTLVEAARNLDHPARIVLAGPFWDDPDQAGIELRPGVTALTPHVDLAVIPTYLDHADRLGLLHASTLGVFFYQGHASFQGSGAIGDYLGHGTPVIATDVANMAEVVDASGLLVPPNDPDALAHALATVLSDEETLKQLHTAAAHRQDRFTMAEHARRCLAFYRTVTASVAIR